MQTFFSFLILSDTGNILIKEVVFLETMHCNIWNSREQKIIAGGFFMTIPEKKIYPRTGDTQTVYLKNVITNPNIIVGEYTMYNDFVHDPRIFEQNNVLYHYPINHDKLIIGKFCSIACGAKFLFNSANHTLSSLSTYPFPLFFEE